MEKEVSIKKGFNENNEEIIESITVTKRTDSHNPETDFENTFYYRVTKDSGMFFDNEGYSKVILRHQNPIDYKKFHEELVPLDWALSTFGYETVEDSDIWRERLRNDDDFANTLCERIGYLIPISKEEYEENIQK